MNSKFDRRVLPDEVLILIKACQGRVPCHLGGGAALSGAFLSHRLSGDVDLFCHAAGDVRTLVRELPAIAQDSSAQIRLIQDAQTFVRAHVDAGGHALELDLIFDNLPDLEPPPPLEGVLIESLPDLRAAKLTCLLSRSEPRDLVDLLFLDRAGFPPEDDLSRALQKDAGIDPGVLAWLLAQFPVRPLPQMLQPLTEEELLRFRDDLGARLRKAALPYH